MNIIRSICTAAYRLCVVLLLLSIATQLASTRQCISAILYLLSKLTAGVTT